MKSIWKKKATLDLLQQMAEETMIAYLGIEFTEIGDDYLVARMAVEKRTHQPFGLLHGGASVALAETVGSMAGNLMVEEPFYCVGLEINANHVRPIEEGFVSGCARPLALGRSIQVWDVRIVEEKEQKLICVARLTLAVRKLV